MTLEPDSTVYENDNGTIREWRIEDAVKGATEETGVNWYLIMTSGNVRALVREADILKRHRDPDCEVWTEYDPRHRGLGIVETEPSDPYGPLHRQVTPRQVKYLSFEQISGEGSRKTMNAFLRHPALVSHGLGEVVGWKAALVARSPLDDTIVGAIVLSRPASRMLDNGDRIEISRLATRADRPMNTASWMLARAAKWAKQNGYDIIQAYSGFAGNSGTCYDAAGFEVQKESEADHERDGWNSSKERDGRMKVETPDGSSWTRRRWERDLT